MSVTPSPLWSTRSVSRPATAVVDESSRLYVLPGAAPPGPRRRRAVDDPVGPAIIEAHWDPVVHLIFDEGSDHPFDPGLQRADPPQHHLDSAVQCV